MYTYMQNENGDYIILDPYHKTVEPHKICGYLTAQRELAYQAQALFDEPARVAGEDDCVCLDDHGTYSDCGQEYCMGCAALLPDAVEPWDGLFTGSSTVYRIMDNGDLGLVQGSIGRKRLALGEIGLTSLTLMKAIRGYGPEWDGVFVAKYFVCRLKDDGHIDIVDNVAVDLSSPFQTGEALVGYEA